MTRHILSVDRCPVFVSLTHFGPSLLRVNPIQSVEREVTFDLGDGLLYFPCQIQHVVKPEGGGTRRPDTGICGIHGSQEREGHQYH